MSSRSHEDSGSGQLLNTSELAAVLGRSRGFVRRLADRRIIPFIRPTGGDRFFEKAKVLAALEKIETKEISRE